MDYTVHGILQARILEWVAFPFSRGSFQHRDRTQVSCIAGGFFTNWTIREALSNVVDSLNEKGLSLPPSKSGIPQCLQRKSAQSAEALTKSWDSSSSTTKLSFLLLSLLLFGRRVFKKYRKSLGWTSTNVLLFDLSHPSLGNNSPWIAHLFARIGVNYWAIFSRTFGWSISVEGRDSGCLQNKGQIS